MCAAIVGGDLLALDTCGERASVALVRAGQLVAEASLEGRTASASLLSTLEEVIRGAQITVRELGGIGVVHGPGSFTGMRVGLAIAKGLCEASGLPLGVASRLEVLAQAGGSGDSVAVLRAGRGELYVRDPAGHESLQQTQMFLATTPEGTEVVCAEDEVFTWLRERCVCQQVSLSAEVAVPLLRASLARGGVDVALAEPHYVRNEEAIYPRPAASVRP